MEIPIPIKRLTQPQRQQMAALHKRDPEAYGSKFLRRPDKWLSYACQAVRLLGLEHMPRQSVLDIGCGPGYFVAACRRLKHDAIGFDMNEGVLKDAATVLEAPYITHRITTAQHLPRPLGVFDLVTMSGVNLRAWNNWGWDEHIAFARTVLEHVRPGGRFVVLPHAGDLEDMMRDVNGWQTRLGEVATVSHANDGRWLQITKGLHA